MNKMWVKRRKRLFEIIEVGNALDKVSRCYDFLNVATIIINLAVSILYTYENVREQYGNIIVFTILPASFLPYGNCCI